MRKWKRKMAVALAYALTAASVPTESLVLAQEETVSEAAAEVSVEAAAVALEETQEQTAAVETDAPETVELAATEAVSETGTDETAVAEETDDGTSAKIPAAESEAALEALSDAETEAFAEEELVLEAEEELVTETAEITTMEEDESSVTIKSATMSAIADIVCYQAPEIMSNISVTINYSDNDTETVTNWTYDSENYNYAVYTATTTKTSSLGEGFLLKLCLYDEDGNQTRVPSSSAYDENDSWCTTSWIEPGTYTLKLYAGEDTNEENMKEQAYTSFGVALPATCTALNVGTTEVTETTCFQLNGLADAQDYVLEGFGPNSDSIFGSYLREYWTDENTGEYSKEVYLLESDGGPVSFTADAAHTYYLYIAIRSGYTATLTLTKDTKICTEHTWDAGTVTKAATCTAAGVKTYTCTVCEETKTESIPAKGHTYGAWKTTTAATALKTGIQTRTCKVCKAKQTRSIAKLTPTIKLTASKLTMQTKQQTTALKVSGMASGDYVKSIASSNTKIIKASIVNAKTGVLKLTAQKKTGKATLTIKLASGLTKKVTVTVKTAKVKTTKISGVAKTATLKGKTLKLTPTITPVTSQDKIKYSTSNKKVATVNSSGVVTAVKAGTAKITVKAGSQKSVCAVTVTGVKTTKITGIKASVTVKKRKKLTLKPKLTPSNSDDKITYSTSNKNVATVSAKGVITAKKKGTATITVKSGSKKVTCKVTVK